MTIRRFDGTAIPRAIVAGPGSRNEIGNELDRLGAETVVVACSRSLKAHTSFVDDLVASLGTRVVTLFEGVEPNTPVASVHRAVDTLDGKAPDAVVAIGGGAVHDFAKAIAVMVPSGRSIVDFVSRFEPPVTFHSVDVDVEPLPVVTVPSTFSAADVVGGGAVTDTQRGAKLIFVHPRLTPRAVILDGEIVASTPRKVLAASGMNAVHHCIEAFYSKGAQTFTDAFAAAALRGLLTALPQIAPAKAAPDIAAFQSAIEAASMSGLTYANSWLGIGHSVCHSLGGRYGLSHGEANAVMVLHSLRFNFEAARGRLAELARAAGVSADSDDAAAAGALVRRIEALADLLGTPKTLSQVGLPEGQFEQIAHDVLADPQTYWNPREATRSNIVAWLETAW